MMHWSEGAQTDVLWQLTENVQEKQRWYNLTDDVICKDVRLLPNTSAVIVVTPSVADEQLPNADIAVGDSTVAALERSPRTYQLQLECPIYHHPGTHEEGCRAYNGQECNLAQPSPKHLRVHPPGAGDNIDAAQKHNEPTAKVQKRECGAETHRREEHHLHLCERLDFRGLAIRGPHAPERPNYRLGDIDGRVARDEGGSEQRVECVRRVPHAIDNLRPVHDEQTVG